LVFFTFQICFLNLSDLVINTCLTAICRSVILVDQKENLIFVNDDKCHINLYRLNT